MKPKRLVFVSEEILIQVARAQRKTGQKSLIIFNYEKFPEQCIAMQLTVKCQ